MDQCREKIDDPRFKHDDYAIRESAKYEQQDFYKKAFPEAVRRLEKAISMLKAADADLDLPLVRMRIKELEAPFESREN